MTGDNQSRPTENGKSGQTSLSNEATLSARLQRLGRKLSESRKHRDLIDPDRQDGQSQAARASAMARGFRLSSELVAGVFVGFAIGWLLDRWLSTTPWGAIIFLLLGFAAGVLNVMRTAGVQQGNDADRDTTKS